LINSSAFKEGWIAEIKLSKPDELKELLGEADYNKLIA
jgi:glycine cleavage system H lipoate-binding protein